MHRFLLHRNKVVCIYLKILLSDAMQCNAQICKLTSTNLDHTLLFWKENYMHPNWIICSPIPFSDYLFLFLYTNTSPTIENNSLTITVSKKYLHLNIPLLLKFNRRIKFRNWSKSYFGLGWQGLIWLAFFKDAKYILTFYYVYRCTCKTAWNVMLAFCFS